MNASFGYVFSFCAGELSSFLGVPFGEGLSLDCGAGAVRGDVITPLRAHSIRGVATSSVFWQNWSVSKALEAASWRLNSVFTYFFLCGVQYVVEGLRSLGPIVAAGSVLPWGFLFFCFARANVSIFGEPGFFLFCGVLCSRFSLSTPRTWPISGIRISGSLRDGVAIRIEAVPARF